MTAQIDPGSSARWREVVRLSISVTGSLLSIAAKLRTTPTAAEPARRCATAALHSTTSIDIRRPQFQAAEERPRPRQQPCGAHVADDVVAERVPVGQVILKTAFG
jgi:hypothetical protein